MSLKTHTVGVPFWDSDFWFRVNAPVCDNCGSRIRRQRLLRGSLLVLLVCIGVVAAKFIVRNVENSTLNTILAFPLALLATVPYALFEMSVPQFFDMYAREKSIRYQFRNHDYAQEFAALNNATVE